MASIMAWLAANQGAALIVVGVLVLAGIVNKDKLAGLWAKITGQATDTADGVKSTLDATGDKIKSKFSEIFGDIAGFGDDIDSTALHFTTLALHKHYLKHVAPEDAPTVDTAFQSLMNLNAKLPAPAAK
jgi:hypothetical protein